MNLWAANGLKHGETGDQFWELPEQGKQLCSELFVVCLRDTENSPTGDNCSSNSAKEQELVVASVDR